MQSIKWLSSQVISRQNGSHFPFSRFTNSFHFPLNNPTDKELFDKRNYGAEKEGDEKEIDSTRKSHSPSGGARGEFEIYD